MSWDPYTALGVGRTASADEVRSAYRKLAKELHPRRSPERCAGRRALQARHGRVQSSQRHQFAHPALIAARSTPTAMSAWLWLASWRGRAPARARPLAGQPALAAPKRSISATFSPISSASGRWRRARLFPDARARHPLHARRGIPRRHQWRAPACVIGGGAHARRQYPARRRNRPSAAAERPGRTRRAGRASGRCLGGAARQTARDFSARRQ